MNQPRPANAASGRAPTNAASLTTRALWVVLLFVGFYALAISLIAFCFWIPWAEMHYGAGADWAGMACGLAGVFFAYAILPRWPAKRPDRPPPLADGAHPRLRKLVDDTASKVGEKPPDAVYLLPEANAFAAREGGLLGFGGRSVVGIGLPLLATMSEDEVRAVLAHEFGHHKGGDLRLGPFVHRTRMAVASAISRLDGSSFLLHWPFLLYGQLFLRLSRQISREQELAADELAAKVVGPETAGRALSRVESLAPRWDAFFLGEVIPLVSRGKRPPMLEGFQRFLLHKPWRADVVKLVNRHERRAPREHDTHPPLSDRLRALGLGSDPRVAELRRRRREGIDTEAQGAFASTDNALGLLDAPELAEEHALATMVREDAQLTAVAWEGIGETAWLPVWRASLSMQRAELSKVRVSDFPAMYDDPEALWERLHPTVVSLLSPLGARRSVTQTLGVYLTLICADAGFTIEVPPGGEVVATRDELRVEPELLVRRLSLGELDPSEFIEEVERLGIANAAGYADRAAKAGGASTTPG